MSELRNVLSDHVILITGTTWLLINVLMVLAMSLRGMRREEYLHHLHDVENHESREAVQAAHERSLQAEAGLREYRSAVRTLTSHPTTVVIGNPARTQARNAQPFDPNGRMLVEAMDYPELD